MGQTVKEVIKVIAPIALNALATAAEALLAGEAIRSAVGQLPEKRSPAAAGDPGSIITTDTWQYCEANFATQYGYYYQGLRSQPVTGDLVIAAAEDIIVWEKQNGISDIQSYLQSVFKDSINPGDSIELANNLGTLFQQRFGEESLEWTPFSKRYNFPDGLIVDSYMVTAAAHDVNDNPAGVASYCWVAYNHKTA
ncbi:MAG: hypothetical protein L0H79_19415 [Intrasporangium sp.]|uniref:hypothetical protein n=1 Tax=Intrasporangium sp. TaxID=1925024 RepID=UPI00264A065B|nr:hypothetical protein [Intrasporangium sp.]MDN5797895.1 hypothetical protein [Intrasporangium sp.]